MPTGFGLDDLTFPSGFNVSRSGMPFLMPAPDNNSDIPSDRAEGVMDDYVTPLPTSHSWDDDCWLYSSLFGASAQPGDANSAVHTLDHNRQEFPPTSPVSQSVGSDAVRRSSMKRRKNKAKFWCETCGADFTAKHNLKNKYCSI
jgi:hypothetical protein